MQVIKFESKIGYINIPSPHEDEMICGYLKRVAKANCYDNLSLFLLDVNIWKIHNNWHRSEILRNDGFSYGMFNVVDIFGIEPVMRMTPLSAYIPFISRGLASRYVRSTCSKRYGNSVLNSKPDCLVKNIRHCPLCDEEEQYVSMMLPQFNEIEEGQDALVLAVCNKMTRELKIAKVYIDQTFKTVTATCEFFYTDEEALEQNLRRSLQMLGVIRTMYRNNLAELSEDE